MNEVERMMIEGRVGRSDTLIARAKLLTFATETIDGELRSSFSGVMVGTPLRHPAYAELWLGHLVFLPQMRLYNHSYPDVGGRGLLAITDGFYTNPTDESMWTADFSKCDPEKSRDFYEQRGWSFPRK